MQDKPSYKGKGKLTETMKKRLTIAARCAIVMQSKDGNMQEAIVHSYLSAKFDGGKQINRSQMVHGMNHLTGADWVVCRCRFTIQ